jgi:hypothetical protein
VTRSRLFHPVKRPLNPWNWNQAQSGWQAGQSKLYRQAVGLVMKGDELSPLVVPHGQMVCYVDLFLLYGVSPPPPAEAISGEQS